MKLAERLKAEADKHVDHFGVRTETGQYLYRAADALEAAERLAEAAGHLSLSMHDPQEGDQISEIYSLKCGDVRGMRKALAKYRAKTGDKT